MASSETIDCILSSSEEENAVFIEENRDLPKVQKRRNLWIVRRKLMSLIKQLLKVLLLTNLCIKESGEIRIQLQKLMATSMLLTAFHANETLHPIIWISEI